MGTNRLHRLTVSWTLGAASLLACGLWSARGDGAHVETAVSAPHLLFLLSDPTATDQATLAPFERLTVQAYRERGTKVTEVSGAELTKWIEGEGKPYAESHKYFQYVALCTSRGADAAGELTAFEIVPEETGIWGREAGTYVYGWGLAVSGCTKSWVTPLTKKDEPQAIPLHLTENGDPWSIPTKIEAPWYAAGAPESAPSWVMNKGRPFVGVALRGRDVVTVTAYSPAEAAGIKGGDTFISFDGMEIDDLRDLRCALEGRTPGTEVEIEYQHEGAAVRKRLRLADYHDAVDLKQKWVDKQVPDLQGLDIEGREVRLQDLKGKLVLLNFWATWNKGSLGELPLQQLLWEKAKDRGLVWVGVSVDEDQDLWRDFVRHNRLGGHQLRSPEWASKMSLHSSSTIFLVDRSGVIRCQVNGSSMAQAVMALLEER